MIKKNRIVDKRTLETYLMTAELDASLYEDRSQKLGEQNLMSETKTTITVYKDGKTKIATMQASILVVPTKHLPTEALESTTQNHIPEKQLGINWLCEQAYILSQRCSQKESDNVDVVLPLTSHLYIESLTVDNAFRRHGIGTAMLDFAVELYMPTSVVSFVGNNNAEGNAMAKALRFAPQNLTAKDVPWEPKTLYRKQIKLTVQGGLR